MGLRVFPQTLLVALKLLPTDVPRVRIGQQNLPLLLGKLACPGSSLCVFARARTAPEEDASVTWIVQNTQRSGVNQRHPYQLSFPRASPQASGQQQAVSAEVLHGAAGRPGALERFKEHEEAESLHDRQSKSPTAPNRCR